ncbi:MAG: pilus assembly protein PilP [Neptuniibacter sp.]
MFEYSKGIFLLVATLLLSGCVDWVEDKRDLVQFVNKTQAAPSGKIKPLPEFKPYHSFVYEGASLREPFLALVPYSEPAEIEDSEPKAEAGGLQPDLERQKEYLESFALEQLEMVGTIYKKDDNAIWALIKDSNSEVHRVGAGAFMGLDFGMVVEVGEQGIVLSEIVTNGRGGWMKRSRNLVLSGQE